MSEETKSLADPVQSPLSSPSSLARLAAIAAVLLFVVMAFAYLGGWLTPSALTPARFTDGFEQVGGIHPGFRRNHAKGVCVSGVFESNGQGARLSKAAVFEAGSVPVVGRFSLGGSDPFVADAPDMVRGLGLLFTLPDGQEWRTAMIHLPVFPVNTPQGFYDRMIASQPDPNTGKADPAKMKAFLAAHSETAAAIQVIKSHPVSSGFENTTFNGLNAFRFVDAGGKSTPVRWSLVPAQPLEPASASQQPPDDKNYLFDGLIASIERQPLHWHLMIAVGQPGDPTSDATIAWPVERELVDAGTLILNRVEIEDDSNCRDTNFDPLVLPTGIEPSDDSLLSARSAVYSQSFTRRAGEKKEPGAIQAADLHKGG